MNSMLTATIALLLLVNPSYGSLKRLTEALSKMDNNNKAQRRSLIEVTESSIDVPFREILHVDFGGAESWVTPYSGDYTFLEIQNGKPAYKLTTCRHPENCLRDQILNAAPVSGKYQFGECPRYDPYCTHPTCYDPTDTPQECTVGSSWTVGEQQDDPQIIGSGKVFDRVPLCGNSFAPGTSLKDKMLSTFNCYRSQFALGKVKSGCIRNDCYQKGVLLPKAAKMPPLVWNDDAARQAQECADTKQDDFGYYCSSLHCSADTEETKLNGNQGAMAWSGIGIVDEIGLSEEAYGVIGWVDEKEKFVWGGPWGHLGGVIKQNHAEVGCGYRECPEHDIVHHAQKVLYCNFIAKDGEPEGWTNEANEGKTYPYQPTEGVSGSECVHGADPLTGLCYLY